MSVWEQRTNQLRKRRQMASREVLFGSPGEELDTPSSGLLQRRPSLSPAESPGALPDSPVSVAMPLPEPPLCASLAMPETQPLSPGDRHPRGLNGNRRQRVVRRYRPPPGPDDYARPRRHRHRPPREPPHADAPARPPSPEHRPAPPEEREEGPAEGARKAEDEEEGAPTGREQDQAR